LYYKYSPALVKLDINGTIEIWMKQSSLDPRKLIPSLLEYESPSVYTEDQAIRYLEFTIQRLGNIDQIVHNYLVSLYVLHARNGDETCLLGFLASQKGRERFGFQYALRLFSKEELWYSSIQVFGVMGMYEQAVDLALKVHDLEIACVFADRPDEDPPLQKRLWLKIARHVVEEKQDMKKYSEFINLLGPWSSSKNAIFSKSKTYFHSFPTLLV
jgi:hypothetical protein